MTERGWRVGELARAAGLTVRTLHHYDATGLLRPSRRTAAGHRLYTRRDVERLYRVLALRQLGLGLAEIGAALDRNDGDLAAVVRRHLQAVERQIETQTRLRDRLTRVLAALDRDERPSTGSPPEGSLTDRSLMDSLIDVMEMMQMFERYYTPEQLTQLEERRRLLGEETIRGAEQKWAELIAEAEAAGAQGLDPASPPVQALARRWQDLVEQFTGGDEGIRRSLQAMYEGEGIEAASRGAISAALAAYLGVHGQGRSGRR